MSKTDEENLLKVLEIETNRINSLDSTLFTIKGWTVTLVSVLVGFAFKGSPSNPDRVWLILAIVATAIFAIVDLAFRKVQLGHVEITLRIKKLLKEKVESNRSSDCNSNIWEIIWSNELNKKKNTIIFVQIIKDYGFAIILYILVIVVGLIYLKLHSS